MSETKNKVRPVPWVVKLLLTVMVGGLFGIAAFFIPADVFATTMPRTLVLPFLAVILALPTTVLATGLYLRECNGWRRSLWKGAVVGAVASTSIITAAFLCDVLFDWLFSLIRLG